MIALDKTDRVRFFYPGCIQGIALGADPGGKVNRRFPVLASGGVGIGLQRSEWTMSPFNTRGHLTAQPFPTGPVPITTKSP